MTEELLAQVVEVVSVIAARFKLRKPIEIPRPKAVQEATQSLRHPDAPAAAPDGSGPVLTGFDKAFSLMASTQPQRRAA